MPREISTQNTKDHFDANLNHILTRRDHIHLLITQHGSKKCFNTKWRIIPWTNDERVHASLFQPSGLFKIVLFFHLQLFNVLIIISSVNMTILFSLNFYCLLTIQNRDGVGWAGDWIYCHRSLRQNGSLHMRNIFWANNLQTCQQQKFQWRQSLINYS